MYCMFIPFVISIFPLASEAVGVNMLRHVTHNYIINFAEGLFPLVSEAHCGYTSLHEYVIQIKKSQTNKKVFQPAFRCMLYPKAGQNTQHIPPPVAKHLLYTSLPALCYL